LVGLEGAGHGRHCSCRNKSRFAFRHVLKTMKKLFTSWPSEHFAIPLEVPESWSNRFAMVVNKRSLKSEWRDFDVNWHRVSKSDAIPSVCGWTSLPFCIEAGAAERLFQRHDDSIELLPFTIEGRPWKLLNCLRKVDKSLDLATSNIFLVPPENKTISLINWINIVGDDASIPEVFTLANSTGLQLLMTDEFVTKIAKAGLKGLTFKHSGYVVGDAAQAIPP
jgi:hypothetical protein